MVSIFIEVEGPLKTHYVYVMFMDLHYLCKLQNVAALFKQNTLRWITKGIKACRGAELHALILLSH